MAVASFVANQSVQLCAAAIQSIAAVHHFGRFNQLWRSIGCGDSINCGGT
jgi:hypothetical protein